VHLSAIKTILIADEDNDFIQGFRERYTWQ
jgi:hypothetical protein